MTSTPDSPGSNISIMNEEEARQLTEEIRLGMVAVRRNLYRMYSEEGWRALHYSSWGNYLTGEFPEYHATYLRRQTNAALLEARVGSPIGETRESHLRAITETIDNPGLQVDAYRLAESRGAETATEIRAIAIELWLEVEGYNGLLRRLLDGKIDAHNAYIIAQQLKDIPYDHDVYKMCEHVIVDPNLVPILYRLSENGADTWYEILHSGTVPAFPDPIPLGKATAPNLLAWLNVASAEHRAAHVEENRQWYDKERMLIESLISEARKIEELKPLIRALDAHRATKGDNNGSHIPQENKQDSGG